MDSASYAYDTMGPHYIALTYLRKRKNTSLPHTEQVLQPTYACGQQVTEPEP